jgi:antitoxin component YwqK of YwqJK toxin-antitoxin module
VNGSEEGKWTGYTPTGSVDYTGIYTGGERDSIWTNYYITGKISSLIRYKNGERHGVARYNTPEGNPVVEKLFEDGYLTAYRTMSTNNEFGDWIMFTANASITANHANGTKTFEEQYKNGALEGLRKLYYANGKVYSEFSCKGGSYDGPYAVYYPNNQLREKGEYLNDELHGVVETYNSDGTLLKTETFKHGIKNGKAVAYKKGTKLKEVNYWAGTPE